MCSFEHLETMVTGAIEIERAGRWNTEREGPKHQGAGSSAFGTPVFILSQRDYLSCLHAQPLPWEHGCCRVLTHILWVSRGGKTLHSVFKDTRHHHYVLPLCHLSLFSAHSCTLLPSFDANCGQILIVFTHVFIIFLMNLRLRLTRLTSHGRWRVRANLQLYFLEWACLC